MCRIFWGTLDSEQVFGLECSFNRWSHPFTFVCLPDEACLTELDHGPWLGCAAQFKNVDIESRTEFAFCDGFIDER